MYSGIMALFNGISIVIMLILLILLAFSGMGILFVLLALVAMVLTFLGSAVVLYQLWKSTLKVALEPTPTGKETTELQMGNGETIFMNLKKGPEGKRIGRLNGEDITIINYGKSDYFLPTGKRIFRSHELYHSDIKAKDCKALEQLSEDSIKETYYKIRDQIDTLGGASDE